MRNIFTLLGIVFFIGGTVPLQAGRNYSHGTGLSFNESLYEKIPLSAPLMRGDYSNIPSSYSLKKYAPTVGDQGSTGTCAAWSSSYGARTILMAIKNNITDKNEIDKITFSPSFVYNQIRPENGCEKGTFLENAFEIIKKEGVPKYSDFGFDCSKQVSALDRINAIPYKIESYKKIFGTNDSDKVIYVKKSISENKPVVFGMKCCTPSFYNSDNKELWETNETEVSEEGGHAMTVIGYDDKKYDGSLLIMNSWGKSWGKDGFIWMKYSDFQKYVRNGFEPTDIDNREKLSGQMTFYTISGKSMDTRFINGIYEMKKPYYSGTLFQLRISNNEPAYVYAFGSDNTNKSYRIFPNNEQISPYLGYKSNNIAIPDENNYVKMDKNKGNDYFCVLYSKKELDFKKIIRDMEEQSGDFAERLGKVLGDDLVSFNNIKYSDNGNISFTGYPHEKSVIPLIVKMEHK